MRMGLKEKLALSTAVFMCVLTFVIAFVGYRLYYDNVMESYGSYAETVLEYAYRVTVRYSFGDMIADRSMPDDYEEMRRELNAVKDGARIEYLYAIYFDDIGDIHSLHYAINAKNHEELMSGRPLSEIYTYMGRPVEEGGFEDDTLLTLQQAILSKNRESGLLDGYSDEYGHMLNGYRVIYDSNDNAVGLICVEIDINRIHEGVKDYIKAVIIVAGVLTWLAILAYIFNTDRYLIDPILGVAESSDAFVNKMQGNAEPEELIYDTVKVRSKDEIKLLAENVESMAKSVASYMSNLKAVTAEKERIGAELDVASQIQADMLPRIFPPFPERKEFDIYATMDPAKEVGGDFYDFFMVDDDHLALVVADVSGKGVPAALFMVISKTLIKNRTLLGGEYSTSAILSDVNDQLCEGNQAELFVTVWLCIVQISTGRCIISNAGHEHPAIRRAGGRYELTVYKHSPAVATIEGIRYEEHEFILNPGDSMFIYTDGVPEATDEADELFGTDRLLEALNKDPEASNDELLKNVRDSIEDFVSGAPQFDDITMLGFRYLGDTD